MTFPCNRKQWAEMCQWKSKQIHLSGEAAKAGLACFRDGFPEGFLWLRRCSGLLFSPSQARTRPARGPFYLCIQQGPVVTQSQMAPCCLLVLMYGLKALVWSMLAGAVGAHGDGASSQVLHSNIESCGSSSGPLPLQ